MHAWAIVTLEMFAILAAEAIAMWIIFHAMKDVIVSISDRLQRVEDDEDDDDEDDVEEHLNPDEGQ